MSQAHKRSATGANKSPARTAPANKTVHEKVTELRRERIPLDATKPPREWRTARSTKSQKRARRGQPDVEPQPVAPVTDGVEAPALPPAPAPTFEAVPELPERYHEDRAVLLGRDPHWIHAWWEVTNQRLHQAQAALGETGAIVLRLYDVSCIDWNGHNHHDARDFVVERDLGSWYIEVGRPDGSFCAEIGLRSRDGRFIAMVRSNVVRMPRDSMSPHVDEEWMALDEEYARMFQLSGGGTPGRSSAELLERRLRRDLWSGSVSSFGVQRKPQLD